MLRLTSGSYYILLFVLLIFHLPYKGSSQGCEVLANKAQEILVLVNQAGTGLTQGNYEQALTAARAGKAQCVDIGFWDGVLIFNNFMYNCHLATLAYDSAQIYAERSLQIVQEAPIPIGRLIHANVNYSASAVLIEQGKYEQGLALLIEAANLIKDTSKVDLNVEYFADCDAVNFLNQTLKFQLNFLSKSMLGQIYNYSGGALIYLLEPDRATNYYLLADELFEETGMKSEQANVWINMGGALQSIFNQDAYPQISSLSLGADTISFDRAPIYCFDRAIRILEEASYQGFLLGVASTNKAVNYLVRGDYEKGVNATNDALKYIAEGKGGDFETALRAGITLEQYQLLVLAIKAFSLGKLHRNTECRAVVDTISTLMEKNPLGMPGSPILPWIGICTISSTACEAIEDWERNEYFLSEAFKLLYPGENLTTFSLDDARIYDPNANLAASIFLRYGRLLELSPRLDNVSEVEKFEEVLRYHKLAMLSYEDQLNAFTKSGIRTLQQAGRIANFNAAQKGVYTEAIRLTRKLYQLTNETRYLDSIFQLAERNKAYVSRQNLKDLDRFRGVAVEDLEKERAYYSKIEALQRTMSTDISEDERLEKSEEYEQVKYQLSQFLDALQEKYPQYYTARYGNEVVASDKVSEAILDDETALLQYVYITDTSAYMLLLKEGQKLRIFPVTTKHDMSELISQLHTAAENRSFVSDYDVAKAYSNSAATLYNILICPIEEEIADLKRLIIIPDGELYRLDFNLLLTEKLDELPKSNGLVDGYLFPYLFKNYAISYASSASMLVNRLENDNPAGNRIELKYGGFEPDYRNCTNNAWKEIRFDDVRAIGTELFPGQSNVWIDDQVSKNAFLSVVNQHTFNILHFSGHSFLHPARPLDAYLALGCKEGQSDSITVADLYNLYIDADLAILASCQSGINTLFHPGEGFPSIAKGFEYAGCPSLIMSQWDVDRDAGREITTSVLKYLKEKGKTYDVALWKAKLDYLKSEDKNIENLAPYYWASMIAWGRMRSLD